MAENAAETVGSHVIEDESQCSVAVFENGVPESGSESDIIAADPSPIVTEALDFKNCLQTKSEIPAAANGLLPPTPAGGQDEASSVQSESSQCIDTVAQAPESTNSTGIYPMLIITTIILLKYHSNIRLITN